jgi:hypothetical protein
MPAESFRYRPVFGLILTCVVVALCVVGVAGLVVSGDMADVARGIWPLLFAGTAVVALFWRPRIVIDDGGVTVVNVFRTFDVPWAAIERIDTRYAVTLFTASARIAVWAAPSPGIRGATTISKRDVSNLTESSYGPGGSVRPGDSVSSPSGQVAFVLRRRWEELRDQGSLGLDSPAPTGTSTSATTPVRVTTHRVTIIALVVLAVATLLSAVL